MQRVRADCVDVSVRVGVRVQACTHTRGCAWDVVDVVMLERRRTIIWEPILPRMRVRVCVVASAHAHAAAWWTSDMDIIVAMERRRSTAADSVDVSGRRERARARGTARTSSFTS